MDDVNIAKGSWFSRQQATPTDIWTLFQGGYIDQQGKEFAIRLTNREWLLLNLSKTCLALGISCIGLALGFLFYWMWPMMTNNFHLTSLLVGMLCSLCALWAYAKRPRVQHLACAALLSILTYAVYTLQNDFPAFSNIYPFVGLIVLSPLLVYQNQRLWGYFYCACHLAGIYYMHLWFGIDFMNPHLYFLLAIINLFFYVNSIKYPHYFNTFALAAIAMGGALIIFETQTAPKADILFAVPIFVCLQLISMIISYYRTDSSLWTANISIMSIWMIVFSVLGVNAIDSQSLIPVMGLQSSGLIVSTLLFILLFMIRKKQR